MKTKPATDMKKEYANPSVSVMELEYNGMLCASGGTPSEDSPFEEGETIDDISVIPGKKYSGDAL